MTNRIPFYCLLIGLFLFGPFGNPVFSQTIAEKKAGIVPNLHDMSPEMLKALNEFNKEMKQAQDDLQGYYDSVDEMVANQVPPDAYQPLLNSINTIKANINEMEMRWREIASQSNPESYALWHQPETTIGQLVMDYGSQDYIYLVPDDIGGIRLSVDSNLPIPRALWEEMLDLILSQNGIGYTQLNPYLRQLYLLKDNKSSLRLITNQRRELDLVPSDARVSFVLTPEPAEVRRSWQFLEKFINPLSTILQMVGRDILIIGPVAEVIDLLKLYDFIAANKGEKEYKVIPVSRVDAEEMARILAAMFDQSPGPGPSNMSPSPSTGVGPGGGPGFRGAPYGPSPYSQGPMDRERGRPPGRGPMPPPSGPQADNYETNGLRVIPLSNIARALFLIGTREEIKKAEQIIRKVESQVGEAREKVIYWYTTRHSEPEELADVLMRIYTLMIRTGVMSEDGPMGPPPPFQILPAPTADQIANEMLEKEKLSLMPSELYQTSYYQQGNYVVNPAPVEPRRQKAPEYNKNRDNFIVDPKTGSIAMVVEADILPKLKDLIKKLDVAKRMVQIEVLLFERRIVKENNFGLNLLKIGECADNLPSCVTWNDPALSTTGILDFFISGGKSCFFPAYNLLYRFLMTQDDVQINASPSVVAVNQTPATIAIVDEISINTGIYNVETAKGNTLETAFTRAQYGITIDILPTIHIADEEGDGEEPNYVTLDTDITFDTLAGGLAERPDVVRRHITNEVNIPDGQTVILGGLRRKQTDDFRESIPFFGELPAIGKFFSMRDIEDRETEMFIFLTPTIISDPLDDFERIKCEEMKRRPGDIPEFLCSLVTAREMERNRLLINSMVILFGPEPDRCYTPSYWRPSTCGHAEFDSQWCSMYLPLSGEYDGQ